MTLLETGSTANTERRKLNRMKVNLAVRCWYEGCTLTKSSDLENSVFIENLSGEGISLQIARQLRPKSELQLEIDLPENAEPIQASGQVIWQASSLRNSNSHFATGVAFTKISPLQRSRLNHFLTNVHGIIAEPRLKRSRFRYKAKESLFKNLRKLYDSSSISKKVELLSGELGIPLHHIRGCTYDTNFFRGNIENPIGIIQVPLGITGPISIKGRYATGEFWVPMSTTEGALVLTYDFGMRLLKLSGPVETEVISKVVHITPMFPIKSTDEQIRIEKFVDSNYSEIKRIAESNSSHTKLLRIEKRKIEDQLLLKFAYDTADAHGLNMINHATFNACKYIESKTYAFFYLRSHYSGVKHYSPLNEKQGQGRVVRATATLSSRALSMLKVTPTVMKDFFDRCTMAANAAGISSVNVHAANAIAAIFMACGQDMADMSSAHACSTETEVVNGGKELLIRCTLRNLLVGTMGGGTGLGTQNECLQIMGCFGSGKSDKFAEIIAATVLAGEFPTAASVINRTYVDIHDRYGKNKGKFVN